MKLFVTENVNKTLFATAVVVLRRYYTVAATGGMHTDSDDNRITIASVIL